MKKIMLLMLALFIPASVQAADRTPDRPHWSLEFKGGKFSPALDNWSDLYGNSSMPEFQISLAYKVLRQVEIGVSAGMMRDTGQGYAPLHSADAGEIVLSGEVDYDLFPLNVFVLARGVFSEQQWVVPYVGGGWTRMFYHEKIQNQETVKGSADGYHVRGGLQLLLDGIDRGASNSLSMDFGVNHTYLFVEAERSEVKYKATSEDLGGIAYLIGLLFEF